MLLVAEAQQNPEGDAAFAEAAAQQGERGDADAAADQDRPGRAWAQLARPGEGVAERAGAPGLLAGLERAEPVGPRADALDEEVEADAAGRGTGLGNRDRPRQEG